MLWRNFDVWAIIDNFAENLVFILVFHNYVNQYS